MHAVASAREIIFIRSPFSSYLARNHLLVVHVFEFTVERINRHRWIFGCDYCVLASRKTVSPALKLMTSDFGGFTRIPPGRQSGLV